MIDVDNHKLMFHPERVAEWKKEEDCYPIYVEIGPTNTCNHRCAFCALDYLEYGRDFIDKDIMVSTLKNMGEQGVKSVMFAGEGEPLLHKNIGLFVETAKKSGIDVSMTTNGVPFTDEKIKQILPNLSWLRFSINSGSSKNYSQVHKTKKEDFFRVIKNIRKCVEYKEKNNLDPTIGTQFLAISKNINEAPKLAKILKNIGADNLQIKPYSHHPSSINDYSVGIDVFNQLEEKLTEFDSDNFKVLFRKQTAKRINEGINYSECYGLPFFTLIDSKGNVIPCNLFYKNEEFSYGNIYKANFNEIWKGAKRKQVIEKIRQQGISECRKGCRLDPINRYLHRLKNHEPHDNFI
ncbi:radical SAM protein [Candidatus Pacearchaeota archaeon]|jgi:radical SAM protein with 4Fe4S-binding SPASM domain|nr:radical SAM protein [Candidatus Pacearchaeota archaeon]|tara:strand:+ start:25971 stop:27020 length:1050 start_codon:yes stop_codon:yes gene_type:complete